MPRPLASLAFSLLFAAAAVAADGVSTQAPSIAPSVARSSAGTAKPGESEQPAAPPAALREGPAAQWIWSSDQNQSKVYLRRRFETRAKRGALIAAADNGMTVFLNGQRVASGDDWSAPAIATVDEALKTGENELLVEATNAGGPAGFALKLALLGEGDAAHIVSDAQWQAAARRDATEWTSAVAISPMGSQPWGDVFAGAKRSLLPQIPRDTFQTLPGYQVELLYSIPKDDEGSWVAITFDPQGRLIASDQGDKGLYRITPAPLGGGGETKVEPLPVSDTSIKLSGAQGLLHAFGDLYVSANGGPGSGLYRARDKDGDGVYERVEKLKDIHGGGEHGPHAVRLSPDGKSLYYVSGNHTQPPGEFSASRIPSNWGEDLLLPRQWDARGHARGVLAPGGWVAITDPDGRQWEMFSIGYRNSYDMAFNADGELMVYDADMEWDLGTSWYRPTRVVHATSGSEFGWRSGTGKWPTYYVDSLPPAVEIGPGSPVGVEFGYGTKFPAKYQRAMYILDWTFGTMYAIHFEPQGASYTAVKEEFLSRSPLPLTDAAVGPDGALYFTVGGRGTQSELYRVTYVGDESTAPAELHDTKFAADRALRRKLEALHGPQAKSGEQLDFIWEHLGHADRHIRYAARIALEHVDAAMWQAKAVAETKPETLITALVALARQGDKSFQAPALAALAKLDYAQLSETQRLELLRAYSLLFIRLGAPDAQTAAAVAERLDPYYPAKGESENRELCNVLVYVHSPTVIAKTLEMMAHPREQSPEEVTDLLARNAGYGGTVAQMLANRPHLQSVHYALALRNMRYGWTIEQRREYLTRLDELRTRSGGASYEGFIDNIRKESLENASPAEREALASTNPPPKPADLPKPIGPGKVWSTQELIAAGSALRGRNFESGKRAFAAARCVVCHRFDGHGGATGPDLTNVAGRFSPKDLAEALVEPSKVISDQYRAMQFTTSGGQSLTGRVVGDANNELTLMVDPEDASKIVTLPRSEIESMRPSPTSLMPADLLKPLNADEVADLLAFLLSRGNPEDPAFK